jgi:hypothetical protein
MEPLINLQDPAIKVVGKRRPPRDSFRAGMDLQDTVVELCRSQRMGLVPKGVYRFNTHEEADKWMWTMLARRRNREQATS